MKDTLINIDDQCCFVISSFLGAEINKEEMLLIIHLKTGNALKVDIEGYEEVVVEQMIESLCEQLESYLKIGTKIVW